MQNRKHDNDKIAGKQRTLGPLTYGNLPRHSKRLNPKQERVLQWAIEQEQAHKKDLGDAISENRLVFATGQKWPSTPASLATEKQSPSTHDTCSVASPNRGRDALKLITNTNVHNNAGPASPNTQSTEPSSPKI